MAASLLAFLRERLGEDGDESGGERAFGEQVAREVGNAKAEQESVVDEARAEQPGHHDFAHQAGDARHGHRHRDDSRRPNHAFGRRWILSLGRQLPPYPLDARHLLEKLRDSHDALVIILEPVFFVGRMQSIVGKAEAHQDRRDAEMSGEIAYHRNGHAVAREDGGLAQHLAEDARGCLDGGMIRIHHHGRRGA